MILAFDSIVANIVTADKELTMQNDLFVSKYLLELPSKELIQRFLQETVQEQQ